MVPVQVGTRIVDLVDPVHAASMGLNKNVRLVRARRTKAIVRVIVVEMSSGENAPSDGQNSRVAHKRERLFQDGTLPNTACCSTVFALKPSSLYSEELTSSGIGEQEDGSHHPPSARLSARITKRRK